MLLSNIIGIVHYLIAFKNSLTVDLHRNNSMLFPLRNKEIRDLQEMT